MTVLTNHAICSKCEGRCCKRAPGLWSPEDLGWPDVRALTHNLESHVRKGLAVFASERDEAVVGGEVLFLMPPWTKAPKSAPNTLPCALLRAHGCTLTFARRPEACRRLIPKSSFQCPPELGASGLYLMYRWLPLQEMLRQARRLFSKERAA